MPVKRTTPRLRDRFLFNAFQALRCREPSLRRHALDLELESSVDPEMIWISGRVLPGGHRLTFAATVGNRAYVEVTSGRPRHRDRVLLRQNDLRLVDSGSEIAAAFEETLAALAGMDVGTQKSVMGGIAERWRKLSLAAIR